MTEEIIELDKIKKENELLKKEIKKFKNEALIASKVRQQSQIAMLQRRKHRNTFSSIDNIINKIDSQKAKGFFKVCIKGVQVSNEDIEKLIELGHKVKIKYYPAIVNIFKFLECFAIPISQEIIKIKWS